MKTKIIPMRIQMPVRWKRKNRIASLMNYYIWGDPRKDRDPNSPTFGDIRKDKEIPTIQHIKVDEI